MLRFLHRENYYGIGLVIYSLANLYFSLLSSSSSLDTNKALFRLPVICMPNQKQLSLPNIKKCEQVTVPLTGHDFTGLGFNICGNMRDGIFIKDVLTRGPANESGLIKAG